MDEVMKETLQAYRSAVDVWRSREEALTRAGVSLEEAEKRATDARLELRKAERAFLDAAAAARAGV